MQCLTQDQMLLEALGLERAPEVADHLSNCPACRDQVAAYRALPERFIARLTKNAPDDEMAKARLLAALPDRFPPRSTGSRMDAELPPLRRARLEGIAMRYRFALGGTVVATVALLLIWGATWSNPLSAMEQTAEAIRNVKTFRCDAVITSAEPGTPDVRGRFYGRENESRADIMMDGEVVVVNILPKDGPGISIDHATRTCYHTDPAGSPRPVVTVISRLAQLSGKSDEDLGSKQIGGVEALGFRIAAEKVDPNSEGGSIEVWVDPTTNLPVVVAELSEEPSRVGRLENFEWDVRLSPDLFDPKPPAGYATLEDGGGALLMRAKPGSAAEIALIAAAFKTYAECSDGRFPPAVEFGQVIPQLKERLGLPAKLDYSDPATAQHEAFRHFYPAFRGFHAIHVIQWKEGAEFGYLGATVGLNDADKVLLHWKLDNGDYRVVYGDLKSETLSEDRLRQLLQQK